MICKSITEEQAKRLVEAYRIGCDDAEAKVEAGITHLQFVAFCADNPTFLDDMLAERLKPIIQAKKNVVAKLGDMDDPNFAMKYLERMKPDEFAPTTKSKNEHTGKDGKDIRLIID